MSAEDGDVPDEEIQLPFPEEITPETVSIAAVLGDPPTYDRYLLVPAQAREQDDLVGVEGRVVLAGDGEINPPQHAASMLRFANWRPYPESREQERDDLEMLLTVATPVEKLEE